MVLPSAVDLARFQFAFVMVWHFLFPAFTIGLASYLAVLEGLWSIKDDDLGGITSPLTYVEGQPSKRLGCFWTPTVKGGRWTGGDTRMCLK